MDDNSNKEILEKLEALRNLRPRDPGLLTARDLLPITIAQMDLTISLFEQQHKDIEKLRESSERLERSTKNLVKYTYAILGSTLIMTGIAIATALHLFR